MALDQIDVDDYDVDDLRSGASKEMSFLDHLEELRWHLIRAVASILIIAIVVFVMKDFIFKKIVFAPKEASFLTYRVFCRISDLLCFSPPEFTIQAFKIEEQCITHIKVSAILGFIASFPYVFYEIWSFVKPGVYTNQCPAATGLVGVT